MPQPLKDAPRRAPSPLRTSPFGEQAARRAPAADTAPPTPRRQADVKPARPRLDAAPPAPAVPASAAPSAAGAGRPRWQKALTALCAATLEGLGQCMEQEGEMLQGQALQMAAPQPPKRRRACGCFPRR